MNEMEMIAGVADVLEKFEFNDFVAEKGGRMKWKDEVKVNTRPFLERVRDRTSDLLKCEGIRISEQKFYLGPRQVTKAILQFDHYTIKMECVQHEELLPRIAIGQNFREEPKAIYVALVLWGKEEVMKEIKNKLDGLLEKEGKFHGGKTFKGGVSLDYSFLVRRLQDLKAIRSPEEANMLIRELAGKLAEAARILRDKREKVEEINRILQESRGTTGKKKGSKEDNKGERNKRELLFPESEVHAFIAALLTKPFVILSGVSGTGKTQLARVVAQKWAASEKTLTTAQELFSGVDPKDGYYRLKEATADAESERYAFMPVRPDWNEAKKVFGFYNPLTGLFYPSDALKVVLHAYRDYVETVQENGKDDGSAPRHFIILDEMNLARVEYYFSDILSAMENPCSAKNLGEPFPIDLGEPFPIHFLNTCVISKIPKKDEVKPGQQGEKLCPGSCESCVYRPLKEGLPPKIGDQSHIQDYRPIPPRIPIPPNLSIIGTVNVDETTFSFAPKVLDRAFVLEFKKVHYEQYLSMIGKKDYKVGDIEFLMQFVEPSHDILRPATLHFGYRVVGEMLDYLDKVDPPETKDLDFLIKSKVLPKVRGTDEQVGPILKQLLVFCSNKAEDSLEEEVKGKALQELKGEYAKGRFPDAYDKIEEMLRNVEATGFASYF